MINDLETTITWVWENKVKDFTPEIMDKLVEKIKQGWIFKFDGEYLKEH